MDSFAGAVDRLHDYTVTIEVHETNGRKTQDRMVRYWYEKPTLARAEIVSGPGSGGVAVWHGGDTVRGHQGGFLRFITLNVNIHDARTTSLRGDTIDSASFESQLEHVRTTKGKLEEAEGPTIEGSATDAITFEAADPAANRNVSREVLYISRVTHLPLKRELFEGNALVKTQLFSALRVNPGLEAKDFTL